MSTWEVVAPDRSRVTGDPATSTVFPFAKARTSSIVDAMPSTTPSWTASPAGDDFALCTAWTAQSTFR